MIIELIFEIICEGVTEAAGDKKYPLWARVLSFSAIFSILVIVVVMVALEVESIFCTVLAGAVILFWLVCCGILIIKDKQKK